MMETQIKYKCKKCDKIFKEDTIFEVYINHWLVDKETLVRMCRRCLRMEIHKGIISFRMRNGERLTTDRVYDYLRMDEVR